MCVRDDGFGEGPRIYRPARHCRSNTPRRLRKRMVIGLRVPAATTTTPRSSAASTRGDGGETTQAGSSLSRPGRAARQVMRIGTMISYAHSTEASRNRTPGIHATSIRGLSRWSGRNCAEELDRLTLRSTGRRPVRITQAQLVGWLEGLFHGIKPRYCSANGERRALRYGTGSQGAHRHRPSRAST